MSQIKIKWTLKPFESLTPVELYAILRLRSEVFVVEQNCIFLDMDNKDQFSFHVMGWLNNELIACTRLIAPGKVYEQMSIGRVVTSPAYRKLGAGRLLMKESIKKCYELFGEGSIKIGAQLYLKKFYESLGFIQTGDVYDEDGIDHIEMMRNP
jgi:ElaA protein